MIRIKCPKCAKALTIKSAQPGAVGACPACGCKFRIPQGVQPEAEDRPRAPARTPLVKKPAPAKDEDYEVVDEDYEVVDEDYEVVDEAPRRAPAPRRPPRRREEEDDDRWEEDRERDEDDDRPRQRKRRRRRSSEGVFGGMSGFALTLLALGAGWLLLTVVSFLVPAVGGAMYFLGFAIALVGGIWLLIVAFTESPLWGLGCLFVPFVSLVFALTHWEEAGRPFLINLIGAGYMITSIIVLAIAG